MFEVLLRRFRGTPVAWVQDAKTGQVHRVWRNGDNFRCSCSVLWGTCDHIEVARKSEQISRDLEDSSLGLVQVDQERTHSEDRIRELEEGKNDLEKKLAAAKSKAAEVATKNNRIRISLEARIKELEAENILLEDRLTAAKFKVSQVETQLGVRIRVILLEEHIKEITATNVSLEHKLSVATSEARQADQERTTLEARVGELEEKNASLDHTLNECEKEIGVLKNDAFQEELAESKRKVLTFDFLKAWCDLEDKLVPLKGKLMQSGKSSGMHSQLRELHQKGRINEGQFNNLEEMRLQRNKIVHHARLLTKAQAHVNLGILRQVIGQL